MTTEQPYTPSEARVCVDYCNAAAARRSHEDVSDVTAEADAEFDRFIEAVKRDAATQWRDRAVRAEAQSETRRQQAVYWKERAELFEEKMNELDRAYISEHGQRKRAEDEQDRLKGKLARRSETVSRLLEKRNNAEARIQAVRDLLDEYGDPEIWAEDIRRALDDNP